MEQIQYRIECENGFILITDRGEGAQILVNTGAHVAIMNLNDENIGNLASILDEMCEG